MVQELKLLDAEICVCVCFNRTCHIIIKDESNYYYPMVMMLFSVKEVHEPLSGFIHSLLSSLSLTQLLKPFSSLFLDSPTDFGISC